MAAMMDPDMDPELAIMLADLGGQRRDEVSAPEARGKGPHISEHDRAQVANEQEARRKHICNKPAENEKHAALQRWNMPSTFGTDEVAEQLQDRWGGQGHRAALNEKLHSGGRDFHRDSNQHEQGSRGDRRNDRPQHVPQERLGRAIPGRNRQRAPSPRAGGVTRFINGVAVSQPARNTKAGGATVANGGLSASAVARIQKDLRKDGLLPPLASPVRPQAPGPARPAVAKAAKAPPPSHDLQDPVQMPALVCTPPTNAITPAPAPKPEEDAIAREAFQRLAAQIRGVGCSKRAVVDTSSSKSPLAAQNFAQSPAPAPATLLLPEAQAIACPAELPTPIIESSMAQNVTAGYAPVAAARPTAASRLSRAMVVPTGTPESDKGRRDATSTMSPTKTDAIDAAQSKGHSGHGIDPQILRIARQKIAEEVVLRAQRPQAEETKEYFSRHKARAWLLPLAVNALAGSSLSADLQADLTVQAVIGQASLNRTKAESFPSPPGSAEQFRGRSTVPRSLEPVALLNKAKGGGMLKVEYFDTSGIHRGYKLVQIPSPTSIAVKMTSKSGAFDPLAMADQMEAVARGILGLK